MNETFHVSAKGVLCEEERILLIEYQDPGETGHHYNLPGGKIRRNERATEACQRKMHEEAGAHVEVRDLLFCYEYIGVNHSISLVFLCTRRLVNEEWLSEPARPDANQTGVRWVALDDLQNIVLYPSCQDRIVEALRRPDVRQNRYWGDIF
jgi:8-oxo-dGTP diphosphatase